MPPLKKTSGGMHVTADLAAILARAGKDVFIASQEDLPRDLERPGGAEFISWKELDLHPGDRWIIPESWPNALAPGLKSGAENIVYVQNWAYLHGRLPEGSRWQNLPVKFWAVSQPVAQFISATTGMDAPIVRPAIDPNLFYPPDRDLSAPLAKGERPVIAWMPRKNPALARQIRDILEARAGLSNLPSPIWLEISGKSRQEVAELLREAHIFLASGFPEGCPLPPLEAMASGLITAGFAGFGGWDYMRPRLPSPACENPDCGAGLRNGFFVADGDTYAAALALERAARLLAQGGEELEKIRRAALATAAIYSPCQQEESLLALFQ